MRARPIKENKGVNRRYNHTTGQHVGKNFLSGDKPQADKLVAPRINGKYKRERIWAKPDFQQP